MGRRIEIGNPPIALDLRRSARARRLSLRVSRLDGKVTLTIPQFAPEREAIDFARTREGWLRSHLSGLESAVAVAVGAEIPFRGAPTPIIASALRRVTHADGAIRVPANAAAPAARVKAFLQVQARDALAAASDRYAAQVGRPYTRLTLRDTRSRWGSCNSHGQLMYSWRLILAPPAVLDYVCAHEVAHLVEMNHAPAFWQVVERLMPDYRPHRAWLRSHGDKLHQIVFP